MANGAVRELVGLLESAFRGDTEHSLLASLWTVTDEEWTARLSPDGRNVRDIVRHAAVAKWANHSSAFGDGSIDWQKGLALAKARSSREDVIAFITEGHEMVVRAVSALPDADLEQPRRFHWGGVEPVRNIIRTLIAHDYYHAGEINHLRSLLQGNDRWDYWGEQMPAQPTETA